VSSQTVGRELSVNRMGVTAYTSRLMARLIGSPQLPLTLWPALRWMHAAYGARAAREEVTWVTASFIV
jgi:hypothetical protein